VQDDSSPEGNDSPAFNKKKSHDLFFQIIKMLACTLARMVAFYHLFGYIYNVPQMMVS
jgi:hypothetical protein